MQLQATVDSVAPLEGARGVTRLARHRKILRTGDHRDSRLIEGCIALCRAVMICHALNLHVDV